jgi:hypothetical protein
LMMSLVGRRRTDSRYRRGNPGAPHARWVRPPIPEWIRC